MTSLLSVAGPLLERQGLMGALGSVFGGTRQQEAPNGTLNNIGMIGSGLGRSDNDSSTTETSSTPPPPQTANRISVDDNSPTLMTVSKQLNLALDLLSQIKVINTNQYNLERFSIEENARSNREAQIERQRAVSSEGVLGTQGNRAAGSGLLGMAGLALGLGAAAQSAPAIIATLMGTMIARTIGEKMDSFVSVLRDIGSSISDWFRGDGTGGGWSGGREHRGWGSWSGGPGTRVNMAESAQTAMRFFTQHGYSAAAAAGIVGNLQQESGFRTNAVDHLTGTHRGIAQWDPTRRAAFFRIFHKEVENATLEEQLLFIHMELQGQTGTSDMRARGAGRLLRNPNLTPAQAALIFSREYERPGRGEENINARVGGANQAYSTYTQQNPSVQTAPLPQSTGGGNNGRALPWNLNNAPPTASRPNAPISTPAAAVMGVTSIAAAGTRAAAPASGSLLNEITRVVSGGPQAIANYVQSSTRSSRAMLAALGARNAQELAAVGAAAGAIMVTVVATVELIRGLSSISRTLPRNAWKGQATRVIQEYIRNVGVGLASVVVTSLVSAGVSAIAATPETGGLATAPAFALGAVVGVIAGIIVGIVLERRWANATPDVSWFAEQAARLVYDRSSHAIAIPDRSPGQIPVPPPPIIPGSTAGSPIDAPISGAHPIPSTMTYTHAQSVASVNELGLTPMAAPPPTFNWGTLLRGTAGRGLVDIYQGQEIDTPGLLYNITEGARGPMMDSNAIRRQNQTRQRQLQLLLNDQERAGQAQNKGGKDSNITVINTQTPTALVKPSGTVGVNTVPNPSATAIMREYQLYFTSAPAIHA